jgi:hypothetical protein
MEKRRVYVMMNPSLGGLDSYGNPYMKPQPKAAGGAVSGGLPYWVGEIGPELFVPAQAGSIVPAGAAGAITINSHVTVNGHVLSHQQELARVVGDALMHSLRASGVRLPSGA